MSYIDKAFIMAKEYDLRDSSVDLSTLLEIKNSIAKMQIEINDIKNSSIDLSGYYNKTEIDNMINTAISKVIRLKGTVNSYEELPTANNEIGDMYIVATDDLNYPEYVWTEKGNWEYLGQTVNIDLSNYYTKEEVDNLISNINLLKDGDTLNITCG